MSVCVENVKYKKIGFFGTIKESIFLYKVEHRNSNYIFIIRFRAENLLLESQRLYRII